MKYSPLYTANSNWGELKGVTPPEEGWEDSTWYLVATKHCKCNPPHLNFYFSGFDNRGYSGGMPVNYAPDQRPTPLNRYYYLKVIKKLDIGVPENFEL